MNWSGSQTIIVEANTHSGTKDFALEKYRIVSLTLSHLKITSPCKVCSGY